ncbi:protein NPAT isoform X1 [Lissotriton helveticus]
MLLPSDVARLVLGYLQQEKLASTCSAFIAESPDLKEYAEHYTDEGFVPGCLLSLFGKNLTTILNEYVSMKAKETTSEVPAMVSSLWKKLEYTISQIRIMQNSASFSAHQRARTRFGLADMRRQRMLESLTTSSLSQQLGPNASNPSVAKQLTVRCALQAKPNPLFAGSSGTLENKLSSNHGGKSSSTAVLGQKDGKHTHLMSPGRRKSEAQRRRSHLTDKNVESSSFVLLDEQNDHLQELIDGNFPKMVIENAREKFLSSKSLQEKLAENINKFLGSDTNIAQASRPTDSSAIDTDNAIDEILGLEGGEIHMSDEAIQDILQQTESDPAFQALFDLFDYGKNKDDKKTTEEPCTHPEDIVYDSTLAEDCPDSVKTSLPLQSVSGKDLTDATRNSSTPNEVAVNNISVDNTPAGTSENSLDKDGNTCRKHVSSDKICNSMTKRPDNSVEKKENSKPTTVGLSMEKEKEKLDTDLLNVESNKQVSNIQTAVTPEHDMPESEHLQSPMDEGKSPVEVTPSTPILSMVETQSEIVMETEKESSVSEDFPPNEQRLPGLELSKSDVPEHSLVTSNVEMEDISSSKGRRQDLECEPDILNIAPLSEEPYPKPFVSVKQFRNNDHEGSTVPCQSSDCSKEHTTLTKNASVSPHSIHPIPRDPVDAHNISARLSPSLKEASCQPSSEEKQHQVEPEPIDALKSPVKNVDTQAAFSKAIVSTLTVPKEAVPSAATNVDRENLLQAISSIEKEHLITSSPSTTVATASFRDIVPGSESVFTVIDSSTVQTSAGNVPSSSRHSSEVDPSSIMSLNIIISDETSHSGDTELSNAVSSISGDNVPTIILSSPGKIQVQNAGTPKSASAEESVPSSEKVADVVFVDQCLPLHTLGDQASSTLSFKAEDGTVFTLAPSLSQDGGFLQLIPASTSFGHSNNVYITTCMPNNGTFRGTASQSKITPISAKNQSQVQTPPRPRNMFPVGQTLSPKVSQGSTIIFASPVQPGMLQMGMIPLSVVGQNRNAYTAYPGQLLRMPAASPLGNRGMAKQPILPKNPKPIGSKSTIHTGRMAKRKEDPLNHPPLFQPQRSESSDTVLPSDEQTKPEDISLAPPSAQNSNTKVTGSHRRVLCFEEGTSALEKASDQVLKPPTTPQNKERSDSLLHSLQAAVGASQYIKIMQSTDSNKADSNAPVVESNGSQSGVTGSRVANSSVKDVDTGQKVAQSGLPLDIHDKTSANKENKLKGSKEQQQKQEAPKLTASQEHSTFYDKTVPLVKEMSRKGILPNILRKSPLDPRKEVGKSHLISPLSKQAGEMLHDIQMRSPAPRQADSGDLPLPRTPSSGVGILDSVRTPTCKNSSEEMGTPRALFLPATPELQGCSPASEAGSENSVSMAAHTLMILSRASIANTGSATPLKDNTQQMKSRSTTKKRKLEETEECERQTRLSKKDTQSPPTPLKKKKIKKQKKKKLLDSFPAGMDVDKFLLSLHYDE